MSPIPAASDRFLPSLLDRLTDDGQQGLTQSKARLLAAVRRDLEKLLNCRWRFSTAAGAEGVLADSLVNYGLPDFSGNQSQAADDPDVVCQEVARAIARFEPRLANVEVSDASPDKPVDRTLRFRIDATLRMEQDNDLVRFTTVLEPASGKMAVPTAGFRGTP